MDCCLSSLLSLHSTPHHSPSLLHNEQHLGLVVNRPKQQEGKGKEGKEMTSVAKKFQSRKHKEDKYKFRGTASKISCFCVNQILNAEWVWSSIIKARMGFGGQFSFYAEDIWAGVKTFFCSSVWRAEERLHVSEFRVSYMSAFLGGDFSFVSIPPSKSKQSHSADTKWWSQIPSPVKQRKNSAIQRLRL